ncbi:MAG TPA: OadG family protein [Firmicutes bacterium]|nr:OadG family protein [Bacillota bacterium]
MISDTILGAILLAVVDMLVVFAVLFGLGLITKALSVLVARAEGAGGTPKKVESPITTAAGEEPLGDGDEAQRVTAAVAAAIAAYEGGYSLGELKVSGVFDMESGPSRWALFGRQRLLRARAGR